MGSSSVPADLHRRVSTRLAWLEISQKDFAGAIGMNQSVFSRAIRAKNPRDRTVNNIAIGLGFTLEQLCDSDDRNILLSEHPSIPLSLASHKRIEALKKWYATQEIMASGQKTTHRSDEERRKRRAAVRKALRRGVLTLRTVQSLAKKYGVSSSQIHADRTVVLRLEPGLKKKTT